MNKKRRMFVRMVLASLLRRRSRMIIALLAIVVGATILSGLGMIYYDVPRQMSSQFRSYGANVILTPSGSSDMNKNEIEKITLEKGFGRVSRSNHRPVYNDAVSEGVSRK